MRLPLRVAPALALTAVVFTAGLAAIPQQPSFRSGVDVVNLGVAVIDKAGAAVGGLTQDDFVVYEEGNHVCFNISYKFRPLTGDWMARQLMT